MDSLECQLLAAGFRSRDDYKFNTTADRARRSRQNGWLGTRVRESQMTCACVRLTTSTEVVHRNHKDRRGASWQPRRTPKGNKLASLLKEPALLLREPAQSQMPFCRILSQETKAQLRQMSTPSTSDQGGTGSPLHRLTRTTRFAPSSRHSEPKDGEEASH